MAINSNLFKPKKRGESDKYSWNIYRYLKENNVVKVMYYTKSIIDGNNVEFNHKSVKMPQMFFMIAGEHSGTRADILMRKGSSSKLETYSFILYSQECFLDITDWFIKEYQRIGRCIFDSGHCGWWRGEEGRFTKINKNSRRCNWCGKYQHRNIVKKVELTRREVWA